jgi:hypothetical protein
MNKRKRDLRMGIAAALRRPRGPFWNQVVAATLQCLAEEFGVPAANNAIRDFKLEMDGWEKVKDT